MILADRDCVYYRGSAQPEELTLGWIQDTLVTHV